MISPSNAVQIRNSCHQQFVQIQSHVLHSFKTNPRSKSGTIKPKHKSHKEANFQRQINRPNSSQKTYKNLRYTTVSRVQIPIDTNSIFQPKPVTTAPLTCKIVSKNAQYHNSKKPIHQYHRPKITVINQSTNNQQHHRRTEPAQGRSPSITDAQIRTNSRPSVIKSSQI